ncbi:MAG TPA: RpiB/LacA/LacB family sugar-phosphate isomerase [Candidatus Saccharimonadales bacterium]|nr:RpiB/LacA/LacB family sugar-phosphate isomerase [Candidatus Saccharimonadales bacterium]
MKLALATDHAGFEQLKQLKEFLTAAGHECQDFGPAAFDANDDYPDFIFPAARAVADGTCEAGIIMGGSGQGEAMAANRVPGVRCTLFYGPAVAKTAIDVEGHTSDDPYEILRLSRQHNHANVLSLSGRFLTLDQMKQAVEVWLATPYDDAERHVRRIRKLDED